MSFLSSTGRYNAPVTLSTFYDYDPVLGILVAATVLFGIATAVLIVQFLRSRTYFILWLVIFTSAECGGYIAFCQFRQQPALTAYLAELILIILAPNFVTLVNYVVISRIIPWAGFPAHTFLARRGNLVPALFLTSDILCLILQGIGGSQLSASRSNGTFDQNKFNIGKNLTLAGISAQLGFQSIFALLAVYIHHSMPNKAVKRELHWAWLCMLVTMVLVCVRNIYRIVEFSGGQHSAIDETAVPYFVLDLLLMLLTALTFIVLDLGSDWVLPARVRQASLMITADGEQSGTAESAAKVGKDAPEAVVVEMGSPDIANTMRKPEDSV
ncbi:hypothetical protein MMC34_008750 [Xylographa carneopallida]|nr:hypothetical protein [Xylographa carneopallida]